MAFDHYLFTPYALDIPALPQNLALDGHRVRAAIAEQLRFDALLLEVRMHHAMALLQTTGWSVPRVAEACGYRPTPASPRASGSASAARRRRCAEGAYHFRPISHQSDELMLSITMRVFSLLPSCGTTPSLTYK